MYLNIHSEDKDTYFYPENNTFDPFFRVSAPWHGFRGGAAVKTEC